MADIKVTYCCAAQERFFRLYGDNPYRLRRNWHTLDCPNHYSKQPEENQMNYCPQCGWTPNCGRVKQRCCGQPPMTQDERNIERLTNDIERHERWVEKLQRDMAAATEMIESLREKIEAIRNRPQDTYEVGTYLIIESDRCVLAYVKREDGWCGASGNRLPWEAVSDAMRGNRLLVTDKIATWRVTEMHQES